MSTITNQLGKEKSPYLKQHENNPVAWQVWGEESFALARKLNRPIFLSIGYSTCYWCHVMEKESFEDKQVAELLNKFYIPIKIDREEHPEIDEIYMDALIGMTGRGGWPMSMFLTTDLKPFWGGTYFPKAHFLQILEKLAEVWVKEKEQVLANSEKLTEYLREERSKFEVNTSLGELNARALEQFKDRYDRQNGGFGQAPKFPPNMALNFLLFQNYRKDEASSREILLGTLDAMASGGIYDHLGGGFHRYSVDEKWLVPHFEKMLYDNALLAKNYTQAFSHFGVPHYRDIAIEILDYLVRDMRDAGGAFYAAEDAGEVGKEGEFYTWTWEQLQKALKPEELNLLGKIFPLSPSGNFEHTNIFHLTQIRAWSGRQELKPILLKLLMERSRRRRPHLDKKILVSWNGLTISALAHAAQVFARSDYLGLAEAAASFIKNNLFKDGELLRRYCEGESKYLATLSDYAYFISGLLDLYKATQSLSWLSFAQELQSQQDKYFWENGYQSADTREKNLILRKVDLADSALPSPNAISLENLVKIQQFSFAEDRQKKIEYLWQKSGSQLEKAPSGFSQMMYARNICENLKTLDLCGADAGLKQKIRQAYHPDWLVNFSEESSFSAKICRNGTCEAPLTRADDLLKILFREEFEEDDE